MNIKFSALILCLAAASAHADDSAAKLHDLCSRQAVGVVAELHSQRYPQMTERELGIARDAAIAACISARTHPAAAAAGQGKQTPQASNSADAGEGKKGWFGNFLKGGDVEKNLEQRKKRLGK